MQWLVKEEPTHYNFDQFATDGKTVWSGVKNPLAQKYLRSMAKGDRVFYYHTGNEKAIVGTARVVGEPYADTKDKTGKLHVVELSAGKRLKTPVTLAALKADKRFADFPLVRLPRLSVMPVTDEQWQMIETLGQ